MEDIQKDILFKAQQSGQSSAATMHIRRYTDKEQTIRAIKTLLKFWGIAACCVLIPVAHFFLVPLFFIMGIVKAFKLKNKAEEGLDAQGKCPACQQDILLNLDNNAELPQWLNCPQCDAALALQEEHN